MTSTLTPLDGPDALWIDGPVVELPVVDVVRAQHHYRDALGFEVSWVWDDLSFGSVTHGEAVVFLARRDPPFDPVSLWIFALDVDAKLADLTRRGANVVAPLELKPWNLRKFTVEDLDGHRLNFHHDG